MKVRKNEMKLRKKQIKVPKNFFIPPWIIKKLHREMPDFLQYGDLNQLMLSHPLSKDIQKEFPGIKGFGVSNMWDMARFYAEYQSNEILQPLVGEISWSKHIVILTKCKETQQRQFYILATKKYGWICGKLTSHNRRRVLMRVYPKGIRSLKSETSSPL